MTKIDFVKDNFFNLDKTEKEFFAEALDQRIQDKKQ